MSDPILDGVFDLPVVHRPLDRYRGCLLGLAVGDALGAPVEFLTAQSIHDSYGPDGITDLGLGWVGEEALAIALYCALSSPADFRQAVVWAVNHSGDSDSTGSICGAIMGASLGAEAIPPRWREVVESSVEISDLADTMHRAFVQGRMPSGGDHAARE